ncbi:MAG: hypothetical protein QXV27_06955 [Candidatus Caldarchaeum sp.]
MPREFIEKKTVVIAPGPARSGKASGNTPELGVFLPSLSTLDEYSEGHHHE